MIVLIRHGEAEKAGGRAIGQTDLPLSSAGTIQASLLAEAMSSANIASLYYSPLGRTAQTASFIEEKCRISALPCPEIQEINLGKWDGLSFHEVKQKYPEEYRRRGEDIARYRPPGGENFIDLKERVKSFLDGLPVSDKTTVLVTHAGVIRVIMQMALDFPMDNIFRISPLHCHASVITQSDNGYSLKAFNLPPGPELKSFIQSHII